jgi:hypothetical protein
MKMEYFFSSIKKTIEKVRKSVVLMIPMAGIALSCLVVNAAPVLNDPPYLLLPYVNANVKLRDVQVDSVPGGATAKNSLLKLKFDQSAYPGIILSPKESHWDWSQYGEIRIKVENPSDTLFTLSVNFKLPEGNSTFNPRFQIIPHHVDTIIIPLVPQEHGIGGLTQYPVSFNPSRIWGMEFFIAHPAQANVLNIHEIKLIKKIKYENIIDAYGQNALIDWTGKVHSAQDFALALRKEAAELAANPKPSGMDEFGGWLAGPTLQATGYFRTSQWKNKWWLVTPTGRLFLSVGMTSVDYGYPTLVEGRESLFQALPSSPEFAAFYSQFPREKAQNVPKNAKSKEIKTYNHFAANLYQKYGSGFWKPWHEITVKRLRSWGFNSTSNWFPGDKDYPFTEMPYMPKLSIRGSVEMVPVGHDKMMDPFDPQFSKVVTESLQAPLTRLRGDPKVIGYYVDNELPWGLEFGPNRYALASGALSLRGSSPAKHALIDALKKQYATIQALNIAWGSAISSWETLLEQPFLMPAKVTDSMSADLTKFVALFANEYFKTVSTIGKKLDPNHLYLGCRFKRSGRNLEVMNAAAKYCDVVSLNIYDPQITAADGNYLMTLGKPCLIGEFHFSGFDRGFFDPGLVSVETQRERAEGYRKYVNRLLSLPCFVGYHWFMYYDEPLTGTLFGEDFNCGFVDVADNPYSELVEAAREINAKVYETHAKP